MRKIAVLVMVLVTGVSFMSCNEESTGEIDALYEIEATEGENGQVEQDPDA